MANTTQLQGEVSENPTEQDKDVERMLSGFLKALLDEQKAPHPQSMLPREHHAKIRELAGAKAQAEV